MASLREIKGKIRAINKTRQVTRAMEAVSAAKMRRSQEKALLARPYAISSFRLLRRVSESLESQNHPLIKTRDLRRAHIVVITSNRGLAGGLNSSVIKKVLAFMRDNKLSRDSITITAIGKKGYEYFSKREYTIAKHFEEMTDSPSLSMIQSVSRHIIEYHLGNEYDQTFVAYNNFISTFAQEPLLHKILPISFEDIEEVVKGIVPVRGKYSDLYKNEENGNGNGSSDYLFEPSSEVVLEQVIFDLVTVFLYHGFLEGKASEFSARMVAMRSASDKALELGNSLTINYNKARQSSITREVSEIVGGVEALAS